MSDVDLLVKTAIPKVNNKLEENVAMFLRFMGNLGQCRSCKAAVWWFTTKNNKQMPVNSDLTSHFSNCPQSRQWRKDKQMKKDGM